MQKQDGRKRMGKCEVCQCDPCDCHGMNDETEKLWGMGQDTGDQRREDHGLDGQGSGGQPVPSVQVATGGHSQDRILSEGMLCTCNFTGQAHLWDSPGRGAGHGDKN